MAGLGLGVGLRGLPQMGSLFWTPGTAGNVVAWYRSDNVTKSGSNVSSWNDKSGNSNNATQGTSGNQPAFTSNWQNGLPGLTFAAASPSHLVCAAFGQGTIAQPLTIWWVGKWTQAATESLTFDGVDATNRCIFDDNGSNHHVGLNALGSPSQVAYTSDASVHAYVCIFNNTSSALYVDGTKIWGNAQTAGTAGLAGITIGSRYANSGGWYGYTGSMGEWGLASRLWSANDILNFHTYAQRYWATT